MSTWHHSWRELRATLALAVPIVIGQVSQMAMNVTDSVMIGRVGTVPLAASAFAGTVFGMFFVLGIGMLMPVAVLVARSRGAGDPASGAQLLRHGLALALGFGALEFLVMGLLSTQLHRFGQPPEVVEIVGPYYLLIAGSLVPVLAFQTFRQFAESLGRPWMPMAIMLSSVVLNVFLNWVLIYGHLGVPELGLTGAGWATLLSRAAGLAAIILWVRQDAALRPWWPQHWTGPLLRARLAEMLRLGIPASGQLLFEAGAFTAAAIMMGWLGTVPLAAHQIAISCAGTTFMFTLGLALATSMRIGEAAGAGKHGRLRAIGFGALGAGVALMVVFAAIFVVGGEFLARQFVSDGEVVALAASLLVVAAVFQVFDGAQVIGAGALRGLTDIKLPTLITFVAYWVVALPGGYWFGVRSGHGALAVWGALAAGLAFAGVFLAVRFAVLTRGPARGVR